MDAQRLAAVLRERTTRIESASIEATGSFDRDVADAAELIRVLARMVEGKTASAAFGAPGDWGYGTAIGDALAGRAGISR